MTGSAQADIETVWAEVGESLRWFVRSRIADPHAADDVVGEVLARVYEHLGDLDDDEKVTAWVYRIARNAITDHYRGRGRRREHPTDEIDPPLSEGADAWLDDQSAVLAELASCIRPLVDALPADYRRALELTDLDGMTQADAAAIEGVSVSGMKSRVQRGRRQFAALLRTCCEISTDSRGEILDFRQRGDACGPC